MTNDAEFEDEYVPDPPTVEEIRREQLLRHLMAKPERVPELSDGELEVDPRRIPRILWYPGSGTDLLPLVSIFQQRSTAVIKDRPKPEQTILWMVDSGTSVEAIPDAVGTYARVPYRKIWLRHGIEYRVSRRRPLHIDGFPGGRHYRLDFEMSLNGIPLGPFKQQVLFSEADAFDFIRFFARSGIKPYAVAIARGWIGGFGSFPGKDLLVEMRAAGLTCAELIGTEGGDLREWSDPPVLP